MTPEVNMTSVPLRRGRTVELWRQDMNENRIDVVADALAKAWREGGAVSPLAEELWPAGGYCYSTK